MPRHLRLGGGLIFVLLLLQTQPVRAQGIKDQLGTTTKAPTADNTSRPAWMRKMAGSSLDLTSYVGSGTFYVSGHHNSYVSAAVFVRPTYDLGTRFKLSANARIFLEQEFTQSDLPNGRQFNPYDIWLWLSAKELHKFERSKLKLGAVARLVVPLSYESRYSHMLTGVAGGLTVSRTFEFGGDPAPQRRFMLTTTLASVFTKFLYTSNLRGDAPGDSNGCRPYLAAGLASGATGGPTASDSDRCGGPVNTNFAITSNGSVSLIRGKWTAAIILVVSNSFRYRISADLESRLPSSDAGRADTTWGILSLGYAITDHLGVSAGLSSFQPALDSQFRNVRFPFFDFAGTNANNYTQAFASLSGTL